MNHNLMGILAMVVGTFYIIFSPKLILSRRGFGRKGLRIEFGILLGFKSL